MRSKKILFLGQTIYLYIVFQYPSPYDYSIYTDYLRVSFLELISTFVALFCNMSLMMFFFAVPTAVHPTGEGPCWCLRFRKVGQNFSDLTNLAIDVRKLLLKLKSTAHTLVSFF